MQGNVKALMVMLEDYGISDEKGYANLREINKAVGTLYEYVECFCYVCVDYKMIYVCKAWIRTSVLFACVELYIQDTFINLLYLFHYISYSYWLLY